MTIVSIIDDDPASIEALRQQLGSYDDILVKGTATNGLKGLTLIRQEQPDVVFLDVEMPDMTGLEFLDQMKCLPLQRPCRLVVYTAHDQYMLSAFRGRAFDFLLKPVQPDELRKVIHRIYAEPAPTVTAAPKASDRLLLYTSATDFRVVNIRDVALFQYNHDLRCWEAVVANSNEPVRLKRSTTNDVLLAMDQRFVQVSQRHILNINFLMEVVDGSCRLYPPFDHIDSVKVGRTFRKQLTDRFAAI